MKVVALGIAFFAIVLWFALGNPRDTVANVLWPHEAAPWEQVIAFYYPNTTDKTKGAVTKTLDTLEQCYAWAAATIARSFDPQMKISSYECGIGCVSSAGSSYVCRTRVK